MVVKMQDIKPGNYVNKSGRTERQVLRVGTDVPVTWMGDDSTEPKGEAGVEFIDVRLGKTHYGPGSGKFPVRVYLSSFARWADRPA